MKIGKLCKCAFDPTFVPVAAKLRAGESFQDFCSNSTLDHSPFLCSVDRCFTFHSCNLIKNIHYHNPHNPEITVKIITFTKKK